MNSEVSEVFRTASVWDKSITLRQIRKWFLIFCMLGLLFYVWQFMRYDMHSTWGFSNSKNSPYYKEIPNDCQAAIDRHNPTFGQGIMGDKWLLRLRPLRIPAEKYLNVNYSGVRCLGYSVLTGLHIQDPLDANFTDTYVDGKGKPIVRISVKYLQPYVYNPTQRHPLKTEEQQ